MTRHVMLYHNLFTSSLDLLMKHFDLGHSFLTGEGMAFIFDMRIPCDKTFSSRAIIVYLVTLTLKFELLLKPVTLIIASYP